MIGLRNAMQMLPPQAKQTVISLCSPKSDLLLARNTQTLRLPQAQIHPIFQQQLPTIYLGGV
jgi:hypothetical protein